ncbi:hypothetical protein ACH9EU_09710 [Kocuria sp. M1R5S2]|uniref:hypothetical protein n=1 Tax=Kocuria rhizosphaerae TaxID=3376285 RepID=UPI0037AEDDF5
MGNSIEDDLFGDDDREATAPVQASQDLDEVDDGVGDEPEGPLDLAQGSGPGRFVAGLVLAAVVLVVLAGAGALYLGGVGRDLFGAGRDGEFVPAPSVTAGPTATPSATPSPTPSPSPSEEPAPAPAPVAPEPAPVPQPAPVVPAPAPVVPAPVPEPVPVVPAPAPVVPAPAPVVPAPAPVVPAPAPEPAPAERRQEVPDNGERATEEPPEEGQDAGEQQEAAVGPDPAVADDAGAEDRNG